jgi:hypothetical protein
MFHITKTVSSYTNTILLTMQFCTIFDKNCEELNVHCSFSCISSTDSNRKESAGETSGLQRGCGTTGVLFFTGNIQTESAM